MKSTTRMVKVVGVTIEGYIFLQSKWYERKGKVLSDSWKEHLKRRYVADLGNGWHGHYNGDLGFSCEEVKQLLSEQGLPFKDAGEQRVTDISI